MPSLVAAPAESVTYTPDHGDPIIVRRLQNTANVERFAGPVLKLLVDAYSSQFEYAPGSSPSAARPLSPGTVIDRFGTHQAAENQVKMIRTRLTRDGAYWFISESTNFLDTDFALSALANTTLSKDGVLQRSGLSPANCYIGNVLVHPNFQRMKGSNPESSRNFKFGSTILYTAIRYGGFAPFRTAATDVIEANPSSGVFFAVNGFTEEQDVAVEPLRFREGQILRQIRYSGPIQDIIETMESRLPMLKSAQPDVDQTY